MPINLSGIITQGHGVASGRAANSPYPQGSIAMQAPHFKARGLDLAGYFLATLNVSIAPWQWRMLQPTFRFENMTWTDLHPPETFSFLRGELVHHESKVSAWLYYPHPETKAAHWQSRSVMEIIAPRLNALGYAANVTLLFEDDTLDIEAAA